MVILEFRNPIPLIIKESGVEAMALYVTTSGTFENDIFTVVLCDNGDIIHVRSDQVRMYVNKTFDITK